MELAKFSRDIEQVRRRDQRQDDRGRDREHGYDHDRGCDHDRDGRDRGHDCDHDRDCDRHHWQPLLSETCTFRSSSALGPVGFQFLVLAEWRRVADASPFLADKS